MTAGILLWNIQQTGGFMGKFFNMTPLLLITPKLCMQQFV